MELREASGKEENCHKKELKFHERSMKTYILKKDLPWAKAGSEWRESIDREESITLKILNGVLLWVREKARELMESEDID